MVRLKARSGTIMQVAKTCINKTTIAQSKSVLLKNCFFIPQRQTQIPGTINKTQTYFIDGKRKKGAVNPIRNNCTQSIQESFSIFIIVFITGVICFSEPGVKNFFLCALFTTHHIKSVL